MLEIFDEVTEVGSVRDPFFRESGVKVFLCREPSGTVQELYRSIARDEKAVNRRDRKKGRGCL